MTEHAPCYSGGWGRNSIWSNDFKIEQYMRLCLKTAPKCVTKLHHVNFIFKQRTKINSKLLICYTMSSPFLSATPTIWSCFLWCFLEPQMGGFIWDLSCLPTVAAFFSRLHIETVWHGHDGMCLQGELGGLFEFRIYSSFWLIQKNLTLKEKKRITVEILVWRWK